MTCLTGDSGIDVNTMMIGRRKGRPESDTRTMNAL